MSEIRQAQQAITEGFLCPNCRRQLGSVVELQSHYDQCLKDNSENGNTIKGLFGKARQKFRFDQKLFETSSAPNLAVAASSSSQEKTSPCPTYFEGYENDMEVQGISRSSFDEFSKIRAGRLERHAAESNKVKIRLSKLVAGLEKFPALMTKSTAGFQESAEWKTHERDVVNWLDEKAVTRCPECTVTFSLIRRKHHCRLCGSILCNDCSHFIPLQEAFEILHSTRKIREDTACASITFRCCAYCFLLVRQDLTCPLRTAKYSDSSEAKLLFIYDKIRTTMSDIDNLLPQLVNVVESIRSGESLYSREEANSLRSKLLRLNEQIDTMSKQISTLTSDSRAMSMLQQRIRQSCVVYIREFIKSVPVVPDMADDSSSTSSSIGGASSIVMTGDGWCISPPDHNDDSSSAFSNHDLDDNPIQQQIRNVKFYIEQAKAAGKMDEVDMLASSLRDLLLFRQQMKDEGQSFNPGES